MQLGTARTGQFLIGNFEVRLADYRLAGHDILSADHSVGVVDGFTLNFNTVRVEVLDGTPALIASQTVRQNVGVQFTFREFSARNWKLAMGGSPGWAIRQSWPVEVLASTPADGIWIKEALGTIPVALGVPADDPKLNLVLYPESGNAGLIRTRYRFRVSVNESHPGYIRLELVTTRSALGLPDFALNEPTGWRVAFASALDSFEDKNLYEPTPDTSTSETLSRPTYGPTPFLTLQLVQTDRETGANVVWDFWKVTVDGDFEMAVNNHEFSAGTVRFKTYDVTENDPLPALCQQYPLFRYYRPISSV